MADEKNAVRCVECGGIGTFPGGRPFHHHDCDLAAPSPNRSAEVIAKAFHDAYEDIAPQIGYKTRSDSAVPWEDVPYLNQTLMRLVVARLLLNGVIR